MRTSPPSLSITCIAMDNVRKILKNRRLSVNGLLTLIHSKHPDCGLPYSILRRLISYERKMTIDEAILHAAALSDSDIRTCRAWASGPSYASTVADVIRKAGSRYPEEERKQVEDILMFLESKDAAETWHTIGHRMPDIFVMPLCWITFSIPLSRIRLLCVVSWKGRFSIHPLNWRICSNPPVWILIGSGNPKAQEEIYRFDWFFAD